MKKFAWLGALGAAVTIAGYAAHAQPPSGPAAAPPARGAPAAAVAPACFYTKDIRNHTLGDAHTLYFNVNGRAVYRVEVAGACLTGATSSDPVVIRNPPGSNNVCKPIDLDLGINMGGMTNHCIVTAITPMSPAEVAALPPKVRP